jgi:hypothetical protein
MALCAISVTGLPWKVAAAGGEVSAAKGVV